MNRIHFLQATWSDIILVESGGLYALIDTGYQRDFKRIRAYLTEVGVEKLEFILITHFHKDHYGSLVDLVDTFPTGTVYIKKFSGLNISDGGGRSASSEYNQEELARCEAMCGRVRERSALVEITEALENVVLGDFDFRLFGTAAAIQEMYNDPASPYYQQVRFGENTNSVVLFAEVNGTSVFLGGDAHNEPLEFAKFSCQTDAYARAIGKPIDLMKVPHHGCGQILSQEALAILRPRYAVVTNWDATLCNRFKENYEAFFAANEEATVLCTDRWGYVFTLGPGGALTYKTITPAPPVTVEEIPVERIHEYWTLQEKYLVEDGIISDPEDKDYFFGEEYRGIIRDHMTREEDRHHLVYLCRGGQRIGVASYCIYTSEDGKCFLLDFWVLPPFRGRGTGHYAYLALEEQAIRQGATYFELNSEKPDSIHFWRAQGFVPNGEDEWGMPLFINRISPHKIRRIREGRP